MMTPPINANSMEANPARGAQRGLGTTCLRSLAWGDPQFPPSFAASRAIIGKATPETLKAIAVVRKALSINPNNHGWISSFLGRAVEDSAPVGELRESAP